MKNIPKRKRARGLNTARMKQRERQIDLKKKNIRRKRKKNRFKEENAIELKRLERERGGPIYIPIYI